MTPSWLIDDWWTFAIFDWQSISTEERTAVLKHETLIRRFPLKTKQWRKAGFNCVAEATTFCKSSFVYGLLLLMYRASVTLHHYTCNSRLTRVLVKITAQARSFEWNFSLAESSLAHTVTPPLIYRNFGKVIIAESWFCFSEFVVRRGTSRRRYKIQDTIANKIHFWIAQKNLGISENRTSAEKEKESGVSRAFTSAVARLKKSHHRVLIIIIIHRRRRRRHRQMTTTPLPWAEQQHGDVEL